MSTSSTGETDVLVAGAGMAGLVAGLRALEADADVIVVEKGHRAGGTMWVSGGKIWTYGSLEEIREISPDGSYELQELIVDRMEDGWEWLERQGVDLNDPTTDLPGPGKETAPTEMTKQLTGRIEDLGGEIRYQTPLKNLVTEEGRVTGAVVADAAEGDVTIRAGSVILATGGFQGNETLVEQHITESVGKMWLRSNPWSTGDGLLAAKEAGAKTTKGMGRFYGHNLVAPPAEFSNNELRDASQYYGPTAIAVDEDGHRFVDESISDTEETLTQAAARRAGGRAFYVFDQALYDSQFRERHVGTIVERARSFDGPFAKADSLEALCDQVEEWGVDGDALSETVTTFNEAIRADDPESLDPPRTRYQRVFDTPPFYAVAVQPGITFTMGGIDIDASARVLSRPGTSSTLDYYPEDPQEVQFRVIPGLYAAGADAGNIHNYRYLGGLNTAVVTGLVAGEEAGRYASG